MQSINPKDILTTLHLIRAGLVSGLLSKGEVIDWADRIVMEDEHPDIFFIDLALSSSKSNNDIIQYFSEYLNFENPAEQADRYLDYFTINIKVGNETLNKQSGLYIE